MEVITCSKYVGVASLFLFLSWSTLFANAQPGFLSIDCGGGGDRTDPITNITWVADDHFIDNLGEKAESHYSGEEGLDFYLRSLRVFPKPLNKACYELPLTRNVPHLLRVSFVDIDSTGSGGFNYSVEAHDMLYMENVRLSEYRPLRKEIILVSADKVVHICLIRTSECDDPLISAIELRLLKAGMYDTAKPGIMLHQNKRCDVGGESTTRYPEDEFDRLWDPCDFLVGGTRSMNVHRLISFNNTKNFPPSTVMETAVVSNTSGSNNIYFSLGRSISVKAVGLLYFAELTSTGNRSFSVGINNVIQTKEIDLVGNFSATELALQYDATTQATVNLESRISGVSPIINALEIYSLFSTHPPTSSDDVKALRELAKAFSLTKWISDPCFGLLWDGIICSNTDNTKLVKKESARTHTIKFWRFDRTRVNITQ